MREFSAGIKRSVLNEAVDHELYWQPWDEASNCVENSFKDRCHLDHEMRQLHTHRLGVIKTRAKEILDEPFVKSRRVLTVGMLDHIQESFRHGVDATCSAMVYRNVLNFDFYMMVTRDIYGLSLSAVHLRTDTHFDDSERTIADWTFLTDLLTVLIEDQLDAQCYGGPEIVTYKTISSVLKTFTRSRL